TRIYSTAKSGRRNGQPQGCSLRSHRLRRLKPLTPTLSPAVHSAMPSMLHCCTSDLKRRLHYGLPGRENAREGVTVTRVQIDQALRDERMDKALLDEVRAKLALLKAGSRQENITE